MKLRTLLTSFVFLVCIAPASYSQMISYELMASFSLPQIDSLLNEIGVPSWVVQPEYEVDYYRVIYETPYKHLDSLVTASGGVAIPRNTDCPVPIASYGHGTQSRRSTSAGNMSGGQWELGVIYASTGYAVALADYLGLGYGADPRVPIHPYTHAFSQAHTTLNMIRSTRQLADTVCPGTK